MNLEKAFETTKDTNHTKTEESVKAIPLTVWVSGDLGGISPPFVSFVCFVV